MSWPGWKHCARCALVSCTSVPSASSLLVLIGSFGFSDGDAVTVTVGVRTATGGALGVTGGAVTVTVARATDTAGTAALPHPTSATTHPRPTTPHGFMHRIVGAEAGSLQ